MSFVPSMENDDFIAFMEADTMIEENVQTTTVEEEIVGTNNELFKGKTFKSIQEAEDFYHAWAGKRGFSIRRRSSHKRGRSEVVCGAQFVCCCEGVYKNKDKEVDIGMSIINLVGEEGFKVTVFENNHTHDLVSPTKQICLRSNRVMTEVARSLTETFYNEGLPACKVPRMFGNIVDVPFALRDCYNHTRDVRQKFNEGDAQAVRMYFEEMSRIQIGRRGHRRLMTLKKTKTI